MSPDFNGLLLKLASLSLASDTGLTLAGRPSARPGLHCVEHGGEGEGEEDAEGMSEAQPVHQATCHGAKGHLPQDLDGGEKAVVGGLWGEGSKVRPAEQGARTALPHRPGGRVRSLTDLVLSCLDYR